MAHKVLKQFHPKDSPSGTVIKAGDKYAGADSDLWILRGYLEKPDGWVDPNARPPTPAEAEPLDDVELTPEEAALVLAEYSVVKNKTELAAFVEKWALPVDTDAKVAVVRADVEKILEPLQALVQKEPDGDGPEGNGTDEGDATGDDETGDGAPAGDSSGS